MPLDHSSPRKSHFASTSNPPFSGRHCLDSRITSRWGEEGLNALERQALLTQYRVVTPAVTQSLHTQGSSIFPKCHLPWHVLEAGHKKTTLKHMRQEKNSKRGSNLNFLQFMLQLLPWWQLQQLASWQPLWQQMQKLRMRIIKMWHPQYVPNTSQAHPKHSENIQNMAWTPPKPNSICQEQTLNTLSSKALLTHTY